MSKSIQELRPRALRNAAALIKCIGHPLRLRILEALEDGEQTVSAVQERTGAEQPAVSRHLSLLRAHGVVDFRRDGANVFYWISEPRARMILETVRQDDEELEA
jgi:ArsR family transcriptional regulator